MKLPVLLYWVIPLSVHSAVAQPTPDKQRHPYESHYLVYGFRDSAGQPNVLALDFNRTSYPDGSAIFEYKG